MYLGFISYSHGEHYQWICKDWKEMYEYCRDDIGILIPEQVPSNIETLDYFSYTKGIIDPECYDKYKGEIYEEQEHLEKDTWISIQKASDYSIKQAKECLD